MPDIVPSHVRSRMMSGIRGKNTKPEMLIRKALHARGHRYVLHNTKLPGKPDLTFPKHQAVILANGCFWHGHGCHLFRWPSTRKKFWKDKISRTKASDRDNIQSLTQAGWRVLVVWECALKGNTKLDFDDAISSIESWLLSRQRSMVIEGAPENRGRLGTA